MSHHLFILLSGFTDSAIFRISVTDWCCHFLSDINSISVSLNACLTGNDRIIKYTISNRNVMKILYLDDTAVGVCDLWWKKHTADINMVLTYWCDEAVHCPYVWCSTPSIWCTYTLMLCSYVFMYYAVIILHTKSMRRCNQLCAVRSQ